jgi:hypothetical protein
MDRKRIAVSALALLLLALGIYGWLSRTATPQVLGLLAFGVAVAIMYVARGGSLPEFLHRYGGVDRDDAPGNIPPRVYLPILATVLLEAAFIFGAFRR